MRNNADPFFMFRLLPAMVCAYTSIFTRVETIMLSGEGIANRVIDSGFLTPEETQQIYAYIKSRREK